MPVAGFSLCGTFGIFCSVRDGAGTNGTYEEMAEKCERQYNLEMEECKVYSYAADLRSDRACRERAASRLAACLTTARDVSRGGMAR